ncbi:MAG: hypothetical protein QGG98_07595 [Pseudomonadales bacterium]|jgi:hypothetical protein|nr:hypothetical protein [Pseudomonadales bacterium]|tara:strand:+ start:1515 stop:2252 length:738 start_codon:yes stop_codon:yes gene_type:complete
MVAVKGSKQYQMKVVAYRPWKSAIQGLVLLGLGLVAAGLAFYYGRDDGLAMKIEVVKERDEMRDHLNTSAVLVGTMRQEIADLKLGSEVDHKATEDVRLSIEKLQNSIAGLEEEIRFYKGVMFPNVEEKGLRIERLDINTTKDPAKLRYRLVLAQVVDKHEFIQGTVEISLNGMQGASETSVPLDKVADLKSNVIRFRFKYFQYIDGEMTLPMEFEPREVMVVARSSGRNTRQLERKFEWMVGEG